MIPNYKNDEWLKDQITKGRTPVEMAEACKVSVGTIDDHLRKHKLTTNPAMPEDLRDPGILSWCGRNRRPIPADVARATKPQDHATVAILGASGFVGTNLQTYLKSNTAYRVVAFNRDDCDAMDRASLQKRLDCLRPDVVVNLSAFVGGIGLNKDNPADMIYRNLIMSANVVDACYTAGVRKLIYLGTVCSYPHTPPRIPFIEDDLWLDRPESTNEPYGVAKKAIGLMLGAYKKQFNFSSAYLIPTNMYGPYDDFSLHGSHVVPAMIRKFLDAKQSGGPVTHWGDGSASRDFLFVDDCCEAIRLAVQEIDDPTPVNIGSGYECSMNELSNRIASSVGFKGQVLWDKTKPNGQPRRCLDTARAYTMLKFSAQTELQTGLDATVQWYLQSIGL